VGAAEPAGLRRADDGLEAPEEVLGDLSDDDLLSALSEELSLASASGGHDPVSEARGAGRDDTRGGRGEGAHGGLSGLDALDGLDGLDGLEDLGSLDSLDGPGLNDGSGR
jgi:hypothetical protein